MNDQDKLEELTLVQWRLLLDTYQRKKWLLSNDSYYTNLKHIAARLSDTGLQIELAVDDTDDILDGNPYEDEMIFAMELKQDLNVIEALIEKQCLNLVAELRRLEVIALKDDEYEVLSNKLEEVNKQIRKLKGE